MKEVKISVEERAIIQAILREKLLLPSRVWVFGSRAKDKIKPFSDLDLAIDYHGNQLPIAVLAELVFAFDESDLPYKVDIVDWHNISDNFRQHITQDRILLLET
jgi:hypothetical protein